MSAVVRAAHLTKDFSVGFWTSAPKRALDDVSFEVNAGEVFGLLGPNGAGKTTALKLIVQLLWPTSGTAEIFGYPAGYRASRARIGFLPEQPAFHDRLTADELVSYFAGLCGLTGDDRRRRTAAVLDLVGLHDDRRRPLRQFSKGMLQRVGLAQALVHDPALVILDEPMSGLDPIGRREVRDLILRLRDEGRTVLFSSHILPDAEMLCSRVAILARGKLVAEGTLDELTARGARGWEVVVSHLSKDVAARVSAHATRMREIAASRYAIEIGVDARPESFVAELAAAGAVLVSVTPLRATLEDVFLERVGTARS